MATKNFFPAFMIAVAIIFSPSLTRAQFVTHQYKDFENELLKYVNEYRKTIKAKPLRMNMFIGNIAERHSRDLAAKKEESNEAYKERMDKIYHQLKPVYSFAENVDTGRRSPKEVVEGWLSSPKHKKNLDGDYNLSGIGIVKDADSTMYITQIFILHQQP